LVRITELKHDGPLYLAQQVDGRPRYSILKPKATRLSLGQTEKERVSAATALALDLIERIATKSDDEEEPQAPGTGLTLGRLAEKYEADGFHGRDPRYKAGAVSQVKRVVAFLGAEKLVTEVRPSDLSRFLAHRIEGGARTAGYADLTMLSIGINWAMGERLLKENPLATKSARKAMKLDHEPSRPVATAERYRKLKAVAEQLPPAFAALLDLAWPTGHRIRAILGVRWCDVAFAATEDAPSGRIRWYAGVKSDKKKHDHVLPMNSAARAALLAWQKQSGGIANGFVFPAPTNASKPLDKRTAAKLLARAEKLAKLPHMQMGGWHQFRRGWATARKHMPLKDVAAGGGWNDTATVAEVYQHADEETTRQVCEHVA